MGKGGSSTNVEVPAYIEDAAKRNLNRADKISSIGSVPLSYGPTVAAFNPMQQSSFANTANVANAFGLASPQGLDMYGGLGAPTNYANGLSAYSAAPIYDQTLAAFGAARPGQKSYIDSFFIDPFTGTPGSNVLPEINYMLSDATDTTNNTSTSTSTNNNSSDTTTTPTNVISTVPVDQQTGNFYQDNQLYNPDIDYSDPFVASNNQIVGVLDPTDRSLQVVQDAYGIDPEFYTDSPIYSSSDFQVGSSATGTDYTDYVVNDNDNALSHSEIMAMNNNNAATNQFGSTVSVGYGTGQVDPALAAAAGYTNSPGAGAIGNNASGSNSIVQMGANLATPNDGTSYVDGQLTYDSDNDSSSSSSSSADDDCVIATHAVAAGGFTPSMKREAVVWCMHKLHNRWYGEAVRRGYRYLGRRKIEQGKAREHYAEFKRYIDFASGKRRDVRGAITFSLRTAQFFAVGLIKRNA
jgi:hypothetical protein